jgi:hypothetical protein
MTGITTVTATALFVSAKKSQWFANLPEEGENHV